jgi:hypothetical protein
VCQTTDTLFQSFNPVIQTSSYGLWDADHTTSCVCDYGMNLRSNLFSFRTAFNFSIAFGLPPLLQATRVPDAQ